MTDLFDDPAVRAGAAMLVLCVLIAAGFYVMASFRDYTAQYQEGMPEALDNFEEMHRRGDISDKEFRTIKARTQHLLDGSKTNDDRSQLNESSPESHS